MRWTELRATSGNGHRINSLINFGVLFMTAYKKMFIVKAKTRWRMKVIVYSLAMLVVFMPGCASVSKEVYQGYSGTELPDVSLALLDIGKANWLQINGMYYVEGSKYTVAKLLPGIHRLDWTTTFVVSALVDPRVIVDFRANATVTLEAGHNYGLQAERTFGPGYRVYIDTSRGSVVAGDKKP
jgi:hypothetical protein